MRSEPLGAVEMVRGIRDRMYEETREMSAEELIQYFHRRSEAVRKKLAAQKHDPRVGQLASR